MKCCVACSEELEDSAKFCSRCGAPQNAAELREQNVEATTLRAGGERVREIYFLNDNSALQGVVYD